MGKLFGRKKKYSDDEYEDEFEYYKNDNYN